MELDDSDSEEIDLLVRELTTQSVPASATQAAVPAAVELRPGSRWTNVRLMMPSERAPGLMARVEDLAARIGLPPVADLRRMVRMPSPVTMVRLWVGLGVIYSASLTFWPYPKYSTGLALYLLCLGLVMVTGIWGARLSWDARLGAAHTIALSTVVWAITLATETLPPV